MRVRNLLAACAVAVGMNAAHAADGPYTGIWEGPNSSFIFIFHDSNFVILTTYFNVPATNITAPLANGQTFRLASLDVGDLLSGPVSNGVAQVVGIAAYRACTISGSISFDTTETMRMQFTAATPTDLGRSQNIDCTGVLVAANRLQGSIRSYRKVF